MRKEDYVQAIEDQDNPPGNGSCQFAALPHQVMKLGTLRSPETMQKEIVAYLKVTRTIATAFLFWSIWKTMSLLDGMTI